MNGLTIKNYKTMGMTLEMLLEQNRQLEKQNRVLEGEVKELRSNSQVSRQIIEAILMNNRKLADGDSVTVEIEHEGNKKTIQIKELG